MIVDRRCELGPARPHPSSSHQKSTIRRSSIINPFGEGAVREPGNHSLARCLSNGRRGSRAKPPRRKGRGYELRVPKLCVSAPLREILLCLPEVIFRQTLRHPRRARRAVIFSAAPNSSLARSGRFWQSRAVRQGSVARTLPTKTEQAGGGKRE